MRVRTHIQPAPQIPFFMRATRGSFPTDRPSLRRGLRRGAAMGAAPHPSAPQLRLPANAAADFRKAEKKRLVRKPAPHRPAAQPLRQRLELSEYPLASSSHDLRGSPSPSARRLSCDVGRRAGPRRPEDPVVGMAQGRLLIGSALDAICDWPEPDDGPGANASNRLRRGKGGIRTLEGALHPLPA
jgi:hypothetical protein